MFDGIFDDLKGQAPIAGLVIKRGDYFRGGALSLDEATLGRIAGVENTAEQDRIAALFIASPKLLAALKYAVERYGKPGGPWNVPSDPGGWLSDAKDAIAQAEAAA